jgi:hypothetical protein
MRGEPRGPRRRGLKSVLERARGLLPLDTAYDYVRRNALLPSAASANLKARGTITFDSPLPVSTPTPSTTRMCCCPAKPMRPRA